MHVNKGEYRDPDGRVLDVEVGVFDFPPKTRAFVFRLALIPKFD